MAKDKLSKPIKPRSERIKEAVDILLKIKQTGISDKDPGFGETKKILDSWIAEADTSGDGWQGKIDYPRYGRVLEMILPGRQGRIPTTILRATEALRQQEQEKEDSS